MTTVEVLRKAKQAVIELGWQQGQYRKTETEGPCCALGACLVAVGAKLRRGYSGIDEYSADPETMEAFVRARRLLEKAVGGVVVWKWNDTPGRTQDEVLAAFDRAIALAEAARTQGDRR